MAPTLTRGMVNSYSTAVTGGSVPSDLYIRDVPRMIEFMRRYDNPMLKLIKPGKAHDKLKWEFGSGDLASRDDTTTGTHTNNTTTLNVTNGLKYQKWNLIRIPSTGEQMLVTAISTNALTVVRNWPAGGVGVALGGPVDVKILGVAIPEGAPYVDSPSQLGEVDYTHPQIMEYTWTYTHRGRVTPNYEVQTDQFRYQQKKKMKEAAGDLDSLLLNGLRDPGLGDQSRPSSMGGLRQFTNTYSLDVSDAPLGFDDFMTAAQTLYNDVGLDAMGKTVMGGMFAKRVWNSFFQPSRMTGGMDKKLRLNWDEVETDFGTLKFVVNYKCDPDEIFIWNPEDTSLDHYEGGNWSTGLYSTNGWFDTGFLRGDFGGFFEAARRRTRLYNFSTTPGDYAWLDRPA